MTYPRSPLVSISRTASRDNSGPILSNMMFSRIPSSSSSILSAHASAAARASSSVRTSTVTNAPMVSFGTSRRTVRIRAGPTSPSLAAEARSFSFSIRASARLRRWVKPPPTATAALSSTPQAVLRVAANGICDFATHREVFVAIPLNRPRIFKIVLSQTNI